MRKHLLLFTGLCWCLAVRAQQPFPPFPLQDESDSSRFEIGATGSYAAGSDAVTNAFMQKLYLGGYIDTTLKQDVYDRLGDENRFGLDDETGLYFRWRCRKQPGWDYYAAARLRQHADALFTGDGFRLVFSGNRPFAGKAVDASGTNVNIFSWKQVQAGAAYTRKTGNKGQIRLGGAVSAYAGSSLLQVDLSRGMLYTDSLGYYIDADVAYSIRQSDTAVTGFGAMNGYGGGIDLAIDAVIPAGENDTVNKLFYSLHLYDIGLIRWNAQTLRSSFDTTYHFEGYQLDLGDLADSAGNGISIDTFQAQTVKKSYNQVLPWWIHTEYGYSYKGGMKNGSMSTALGIRFRNYGNMQPDYYLRHSICFGTHWKLGVDAGYGGYTRFHAGLDVQANYSGWLVRLGSSNLAGYLVPGSSTAQGAYVVLGKRF